MRRPTAIAPSPRAAVAALGLLAMAAAGFPAKEVPTEEWVESLCKSFTEWAEDLAAARDDPGFGADDLRVRKQTLIESLDGQTDATATLLKRFRKAGTPDVKDGKGIARTFRKAYQRARRAAADAAKDAEDIRTRNLEVYEKDALELQEQIVEAAAEVGEAFDLAAEKYDTRKVDAAFRAEPACAGTP
jgi:hypothetical protein